MIWQPKKKKFIWAWTYNLPILKDLQLRVQCFTTILSRQLTWLRIFAQFKSNNGVLHQNKVVRIQRPPHAFQNPYFLYYCLKEHESDLTTKEKPSMIRLEPTTFGFQNDLWSNVLPLHHLVMYVSWGNLNNPILRMECGANGYFCD